MNARPGIVGARSRARRRGVGRASAPLLLLLLGCVGGEPRRPGGSEPRRIEPEYAPERHAEPDPWSVEAALPRSGDPARPNVKVELTVVDVASARELAVRGRVRGGVVRGVVSARAALSLGASEGRSRSRSSTFILVQAGRAGTISLTDDVRLWLGLGPRAGLHVHVGRASVDGVELAIAPYVAPTAVPGETVEGATTITVQPGEAVLLGGVTQEDAREERGLGRHAERASSRQMVVLLLVDVIG